MLEVLRDAGFVNEAIWYFGDQPIIYIECENSKKRYPNGIPLIL